MNNTEFDQLFTTFLNLLDQDLFSIELWDDFLQKFFPDYTKTLQQNILADLEFFKGNDPASKSYSWDQILSVRRGMLAIWAHRVFQTILKEDEAKLFEVEVLAKKIQTITNVEIHPRATIGENFAIDHGHGTVIGETAQVGNNVFIYHGVTLGATGKRSKTQRRHPILGNNVFLGNGAQILGPSVLQNDVFVSSESMILDSFIESEVHISPCVQISKSFVPKGMKIFGYVPEERKYVVQKKGESVTKKIKLDRFLAEELDV